MYALLEYNFRIYYYQFIAYINFGAWFGIPLEGNMQLGW